MKIKENKSYNVLKDGVRDAASGALIASGTSGLIKLFKSRKALKKTCEIVDTAGEMTTEEIAKVAANEAANENAAE